MTPECQKEPALWFPEGLEGLKKREGELPPDYKSEDAMRARALCAECPLREMCLEVAKEARPEYGIWAGLSPQEIMIEVTKDAMRH